MPDPGTPELQTPESQTSEPPTPEIVLGLLIAGMLDDVDRAAVDAARNRVVEILGESFPAYAWSMPVAVRKELKTEEPMQPVRLVDVGVVELQQRRWDFAMVVTAGDLVGYAKRIVYGAPSNALEAAVVSTSRLDPLQTIATAAPEERTETIARRLTALILHQFGHLNDLPHVADPADVMFDIQSVLDLDPMTGYGQAGRETMSRALAAVADDRLEEMAEANLLTGTWFAVRAFVLELPSILAAIRRAKPWVFPFRFSRLSTAATSTALVLLITAEAWDLGMSQPAGRVIFLSLAALLGTSGYLLVRQNVLGRRRTLRRPSEQRVVARAASTGVVLAGMATTYGAIFVSVLLLGLFLFSETVANGWAASLERGIVFTDYLVFAGFVATLGLLIGALGASFEQETYFRHVTLLDEET
ncbi:MAG: DUF2391 domain-containing protein [Bacteroidota bacterium]